MFPRILSLPVTALISALTATEVFALAFPSDSVLYVTDGAHHFLTRSHDYVLLALVLVSVALLVINYFRIKSQRALQESEQRFQALAERSVVGISIVQDGIYKFVNPCLAEMFGYNQADLIGKKGPADFVHPDDRPRVEASMKKRISGEEDFAHYEVRMVNKQGTTRFVEVFGSRMTYQGRPAIVASLLDITGRKKTAQALEKAHSDLNQIFDSAAPLYVIDKEYMVLRVNDTFCQHVGLSADELEGRKCYDVWPGSRCRTPDCPMEQILLGASQVDYDREHAHVSGRVTAFKAVALPYLGVDGSVEGIIASFSDITELKERERALQASEEKSRAQFISIPVPTYIWQWVDDNFVLKDHNEEAVKITDGEVVGFLNCTFDQVYPDRPVWKAKMLRCLREQISIRSDEPTEYVFNSTGKRRFLSISFAYVPPDFVMVHTADVTARTEAEEALRESEARFRELAEKAPVGIYLVQNMKLAYANPAVVKIFGYPVEEIMQNPAPIDLVHPDDKPVVTGILAAFARSEIDTVRYEIRIRTGDGTMKHLEITASPTMYQDQPAYIGTAVDITERKKAEEALVESEKKFRTLAETSTAGIIIYNDQGTLYTNPAIEAISGYSTEEQRSIPPWDLARPDFKEMLKSRARERLSGSDEALRAFEIPIITKSGQERWVLYTGGVIQYGGSPAVLGTAVDITEGKKAQAELQLAHQERYDQVKQIAGGVAHEIYNALFPASSTLDKLKARIGTGGGSEADRDIKLLSLAEISIERAIEMTELVTQLSKLDSNKDLSPLMLAELIDELLAERDRVRQLEVKINLQVDDNIVINMSRIHAFSLFSNLINNALDALEDVSVRAIDITAKSNPDHVRIMVSDTGPGIAPEIISKIFNPFFSTKPRTGTGLGLAICKRIIDIYQGEISVESAVDKGATFTILLKT